MKSSKFMTFFSRLGAAMFVPVLLFAFAGIMVAITTVLSSPSIVGDLADPSGVFFKIVYIVKEGAWTIFRQLPIVFVLGLPIALAEKAPGRAVLGAVISYLTFNYFISAILTQFGGLVGIDMSQAVKPGSGLAMIAGIKTLDTGMIGSLLIAYIVTDIHNKYFDTQLPEWLGTFNGTCYVVIRAFFVLLPVSVLTVIIWPQVQMGINSLQGFMANSGLVGVWVFTFLERALIPTGLHHFIYGPFSFGPAIVPEGLTVYYPANLETFIAHTGPLIDIYPEGAFRMYGMSKVFASPGIAAAIYFTAKPDQRTRVASLLIPVTLTAMMTGITEPLEFTFLFLAPILFLVHSLLAATLATVAYAFGVTGDFGSGLINWFATSWIPLFQNHSEMIFTQIIIGLIFTGIYFIVFKLLIEKLNIKTPGREEESEMKLYTKKDFKNKDITSEEQTTTKSEDQALIFLTAIGGKENVKSVTNCATRLRISVKDPQKIEANSSFKIGGAHGVVRSDNNIQIIVGLTVPQVREAFEKLL